MKVIIRWEEPRPARASSWRPNPGSMWDDVAEALKFEAPSSAVIAEHVTRYDALTLLTLINSARVSCFRPAGAYRATTRKDDDAPTFTVYAKYVGSAEQ